MKCTVCHANQHSEEKDAPKSTWQNLKINLSMKLKYTYIVYPLLSYSIKLLGKRTAVWFKGDVNSILQEAKIKYWYGWKNQAQNFDNSFLKWYK